MNCYRTTVIAIVSVFVVFSASAEAASRNSRTPAGQTDPAGTQPTRREQMRLEAQATHQQIKDLLTEVLGAAVKNERPADSLLQKCEAALEDNKQNALAYDEKQRADYMLLQAWTGYYQGNLPEALNWSMRACKQDEASQDAWISQAVFNMLSGKRPLEPRIEKPKLETDMRRTMNPRPRRNNQPEVQKYEPEPYSVKGVFDFDLPAVRSEMFRERFERMECRTTSGKTVEYVPGRDLLCALFYQSEGSSADSDPNRPGANGSQNVMGEFQMQGYTASGAVDIDSQRQYFLNVMKSCKDAGTIKFLQVDTIRPKDLANVSLSSYDAKGIATVIPASPESNAKQLVCDASDPFMMIVDKDGTVKYAGPAMGFVPAFILTEISGQPVSLGASGDGGMGMPLYGEQSSELMEMYQNTPAADPNQPQANRQTGQSQAVREDFPGQDLIDEVSAQKLLQEAQMDIEQSRKLGDPKQGIAAARRVIELYPNTPEAQQAKELLRIVPPKYKDKYGITPEELL
jgi:hypothetical protein